MQEQELTQFSFLADLQINCFSLVNALKGTMSRDGYLIITSCVYADSFQGLSKALY
jgi:hypothetical protein